MWVCRAVLAGERVCETENFDDWNQCSNCAAPRQATSVTFEPKDDSVEIGTAIISGAKAVADKARQYAPMAAAAAVQAKERAGDVALHSRIATQTGLHIVSVIAFCAVLLVASIVLPVVLAWPLTLSITTRNDVHSVNAGYEAEQQLQGAIQESTHVYDGAERVISFVPNRLTDPRKSKIVTAVLFCGPILITGSPVQIHGTGQGLDGGTAMGRASLSLENNSVFWILAAVLLALLIIADVLIGDIYAMQKLLTSLIVVWVGYCLLLGLVSQSVLRELGTQFFPDAQLGLTMSGLMTGPLKIGFIGLIYWMSSMLLRSFRQDRLARAERQRLETT